MTYTYCFGHDGSSGCSDVTAATTSGSTLASRTTTSAFGISGCLHGVLFSDVVRICETCIRPSGDLIRETSNNGVQGPGDASSFCGHRRHLHCRARIRRPDTTHNTWTRYMLIGSTCRFVGDFSPGRNPWGILTIYMVNGDPLSMVIAHSLFVHTIKIIYKTRYMFTYEKCFFFHQSWYIYLIYIIYYVMVHRIRSVLWNVLIVV